MVITMLSLAVPASFAQTDTTRQTTTTTDPVTGQQTQTTTTQTKVESDHNDDRWHYNHGEIGLFADYFRLEAADTNHWGVGGRGAFGIHPHVQLEGEIAYDFTQSRSATVTDSLGNITTARASFRVLHGLFGPKFQTTGPVRLFAVVKGGFVNFRVETTAITLGNVPSVFNGVVDGDTHPAFYPGGGIEAFAGWFGVRGDIGDEMYFANGTHHNLRFSVGPVFRF
jgi:hypothetical protein